MQMNIPFFRFRLKIVGIVVLFDCVSRSRLIIIQLTNGDNIGIHTTGIQLFVARSWLLLSCIVVWRNFYSRGAFEVSLAICDFLQFKWMISLWHINIGFDSVSRAFCLRSLFSVYLMLYGLFRSHAHQTCIFFMSFVSISSEFYEFNCKTNGSRYIEEV